MSFTTYNDVLFTMSPEGPQQIGQMIGPYEVVAKLGEGGPPPLARVFRELGRDLAVAQKWPR